MTALPYPVPTPVFHITPIDNLASIAKVGAILSKTHVAQQHLVAGNIAYHHIQGRRAVRRIPIAPGGTLHDYVPLYFGPRSPMLYTINNGNVPDCNWMTSFISLHRHSLSTMAVTDSFFPTYTRPWTTLDFSTIWPN
jgi:hypothetical protein